MMSHDPVQPSRVYLGHQNDEESLRVAFLAQQVGLQPLSPEKFRLDQVREEVKDIRRKHLGQITERLPRSFIKMLDGVEREAPTAQTLVLDEVVGTVGLNLTESLAPTFVYTCRVSLRSFLPTGRTEYGIIIEDQLEKFSNPVCVYMRVENNLITNQAVVKTAPMLTPGALAEALTHACEVPTGDSLVGCLFEAEVQKKTVDPDISLVAMQRAGEWRFAGTFTKGLTCGCKLSIEPITLIPLVELFNLNS